VASSTTGIASEHASKSTGGGERIAVYAGTTFLSAFLLFQVQPLIGKAILPWFGGGSAVWTTTMLFFQVALLAGYAYAHFVSNRLSLRRQGMLHIALLAIAALTIPIIPDAVWKPEDGGDPTLRVLIVLALTVGAPYTLLSATAPLVQRWFTHDHPGVSPYRLYSLSNIGSLLALLTYPILFERFLGLQTQAWLWSGSYVVFAVACSYLAWRVASRARPDETTEDLTEEGGTAAVTPANVALWLALPACASVVLLATTNQLTQDVASIPLLWVLPLALYLLTFILCFGDDRTYQPLRDVPLLAAGLGVGAFLLGAITMALLWQILLYAGSLFIACFTLHGELVRLRPASRHLTAFYLMVSVGGALGGVLVAIAAPALFTGYWEYHLALVATGALVAVARGLDLWRHPLGGSMARTKPLLLGGGAAVCAGLAALGVVLVRDAQGDHREALHQTRNFYGTVRVFEYDTANPLNAQRVMVHGRILHGFQYLAPEKRSAHTGYYSNQSGVGLTLLHHPARQQRPLHVGVLGLGAGMIVAYAERGDTYTLYEINDTVIDFAEEQFTYLKDARERGATVETHLGDGRLVLDRQLAAGEPQQFDVLVLDAFSSDSVPMHLLTREAFELYTKHLAPGGILAINISNRHVDLSPVIRGIAAELGHEVGLVSGQAGDTTGILYSVWMMMTPNRAFFQAPPVASGLTPWPETARAPMIWTDDYSTIYDLLHLY
jgi:hypothetical protein